MEVEQTLLTDIPTVFLLMGRDITPAQTGLLFILLLGITFLHILMLGMLVMEITTFTSQPTCHQIGQIAILRYLPALPAQ